MKKVIETQNLTKKYKGISAVQDLNIDIYSGEIFGFLGPNGAGKTTTIRVLTTLAKPTTGIVRVVGFNASEEPDEVKKVIGGFSSISLWILI